MLEALTVNQSRSGKESNWPVAPGVGLPQGYAHLAGARPGGGCAGRIARWHRATLRLINRRSPARLALKSVQRLAAAIASVRTALDSGAVPPHPKQQNPRRIMKARCYLTTVLALPILAGIPGCSKGGGEPTVATTPIAQLIQAGRAPVEVTPLARTMSPVAPTFSLKLTNVSDVPISAVMGTVVYCDGDGKALPGAVADSGYSDLSPIAPGTSVQLSIMTSEQKAVRGKWILKDALYEKPNPLGKNFGTLSFKWKNPNYDAELAAEKAR